MSESDGWSEVAKEWHELWGSFPAPVHAAIIELTRITAGTRVLDVGAGSGEFVSALLAQNADAHGVDPAAGMVAIAGPSVVKGDAEHLPFGDIQFDVVTAINALQFAEDTMDALAEFARVTKPGGLIAIANWAEASFNDIDAVEKALEGDDEHDEEDEPDDELRVEGGLGALLEDAGLTLVTETLVEAPWHAPDDDALVRGVLLGADPDTQQEFADAVKAAAEPYKATAGGYVLNNAFRLAIGRVE